MKTDLTSTQQQLALGRSAQSDACGPSTSRSIGSKEVARGRGAGAFDWSAPAPRLFNETKLAIIAVMLELDRPVTARELQGLLKEPEELSIFEYHLNTLVKAEAAELVVDPDELRFRLGGSNPQGVEEFLASMPLRACRLKRS